jgi:NTE family protein
MQTDMRRFSPLDREVAMASPARGAMEAAVRRPHRRTAFMLCGGGAHGALQVGALRALLEGGISPDMVVGTSVGAWNATAIARMPTLDGIHCLTTLWQNAHTAQVLLGRRHPISARFGLNAMLLWNALRRGFGKHPSLLSNSGLQKLLTNHLGDMTFDELALPLLVTATNLTTGERAIFRSGKLIPALLASSAIPGVFPPVWLGDGLYVDGISLDSACFDEVIARGAERIVVLAIGCDLEAPGSSCWRLPVPADPMVAPTWGRNASPAGVIERWTRVWRRAELDQIVRRLPPSVETHVIPLTTGNDGGVLDFARVPHWIERGYDLTRAHMAKALSPRHLTPGAAERATTYDIASPIPA